jgi:hypothetical protein
VAPVCVTAECPGFHTSYFARRGDVGNPFALFAFRLPAVRPTLLVACAGAWRDFARFVELEVIERQRRESGFLATKVRDLGRGESLQYRKNTQLSGTGRVEEAINSPFSPLQETFHTFVLRGLRNIPEAP